MADPAESLVLTPEEEQELAIYRDPVTFARVILDLDPRPYQVEILRDVSKRIVLRMGRQVGKCVVGSTRVIDAETGEVKTVQEVYDEDPEERGPILTLDPTYKVVKTDAYFVEDNGVKDVYRVTTKLGRSVTLTANHPLLTIKGWYPVEDLAPGDRIAVPRSMPFFGNNRLPDSEVKILAYIIGDGCVTSRAVKFTTADDMVIEDFRRACQSTGPVHLVRTSEYNYDVRLLPGSKRRNPVTSLLRKHKVFGKSSLEKSVPQAIFGLEKRQVALFLNRLYACDGWASVSNVGNRKPEIGYASSSEQLARDVQHLLLRFGIMASLTRRRTRYMGEYRTSWTVAIHRKHDIEVFAREIGIFSKEMQLEKVLLRAEDINDNGNHDTVPREIWDQIEELRIAKGLTKSAVAGRVSFEDDRRLRYEHAPSRIKLAGYATVLEDEELADLASSDIYWDTIASIEYVGRERTYDLSVPGSANFIADDIFVHNTFTLALYILWFVFTHRDVYVMVAAPYEQHVKKIFQELRRFIRSSDVLTAAKVRDVKGPEEIEFGNGSKIVGFTSGAKSGTKGDSARGQSPNLIVLDEVDRMTDDDLDSILAARFANPAAVRIMMASTPTGRRQKFYNWCVTAQGGLVQVEAGRYSNKGWTTYYFPSTVNPNWQIVDPETGMTPEEELRQSGELSEQGWIHEVLAEFGEEVTGVFRKSDIEAAISSYTYVRINDKTKMKKAKRTIGVDWDKYRDSGTNIVVTEYDTREHAFKAIYREEIPKGEFTFDHAVSRIVELNKVFDPDWIYLDAGHGEYQYEALRKYGKDHPESGLMKKVYRIHFSENREVRDPGSSAVVKKKAKPFMVNQTQTLLERGRIKISKNDQTLIRQFTNYSVVRITSSGEPQYTSVDEHVLDAFMLSILAFAEKEPELAMTLFPFRAATRIEAVSLASKQKVHEELTLDAPEEVKKDPYELYDWKLKNSRRLARSAMGGRFSGFSRRQLSLGPNIRRVF